MSVTVVYKDIAPGAAEGAAISTTSAQDLSSPQQLLAGGSIPPIVTLEHGNWLLNGKMVLYRGQPIPFMSTAMSGSDCWFSEPPELEVVLDNVYSCPGITIEFAPETGDRCSTVTLTWLNAGAVVAEETFYPDAAVYYCERRVSGFNGLKIRFDATHLPRRYARCQRIQFGVIREFGIDELRRVMVEVFVDPVSMELQANTSDWILESKDKNANYIFRASQPQEVRYDGNLIGAFRIERGLRHGIVGNLYDVESHDAKGVLNSASYGPVMITESTPALTVLQDIVGGAYDIEMDDALQALPVKGYIPKTTKLEAIRLVLVRICAALDTNGRMGLRIFSLAADGEAKIIPAERVDVGGEIERDDKTVTAVAVSGYSWSTTPTDGDSVDVGGVTYYAEKTTVTVTNPDADALDAENILSVEDCTLVTPDVAETVAGHLMEFYRRRETFRGTITVNGEMPGDYVSVITPWGEQITGHIIRMATNFSNAAKAEIEVIGE